MERPVNVGASEEMGGGSPAAAAVREGDDAIVVEGLTRRYGKRVVVDDLSFTVPRGRIVGFLGPNGSGKTTTLRMLTGLVRPHGGVAMVLGRPIAEIGAVAGRYGALIEAPAFYERNSGRMNLRIQARLTGAGDDRVDELIAHVGLGEHARKKVGDYSLGMRQRLAIANALLTDPELLLLDEPGNGLDPAGVAALRDLLKDFARRGGTVLVSSHLLAEIEATCDEVVVIDHGRLVVQGPVADLVARGARHVVVTADHARTAAVLSEAGLAARADGGRVVVTGGGGGEAIGQALLEARIAISALYEEHDSLESVFVRITETGESWGSTGVWSGGGAASNPDSALAESAGGGYR